jgi:hypothetical protein
VHTKGYAATSATTPLAPFAFERRYAEAHVGRPLTAAESRGRARRESPRRQTPSPIDPMTPPADRHAHRAEQPGTDHTTHQAERDVDQDPVPATPHHLPRESQPAISPTTIE